MLVRDKGKIKPNKVKKNYIYDLKEMRPVEDFINEYPDKLCYFSSIKKVIGSGL